MDLLSGHLIRRSISKALEHYREINHGWPEMYVFSLQRIAESECGLMPLGRYEFNHYLREVLKDKREEGYSFSDNPGIFFGPRMARVKV